MNKAIFGSLVICVASAVLEGILSGRQRQRTVRRVALSPLLTTALGMVCHWRHYGKIQQSLLHATKAYDHELIDFQVSFRKKLLKERNTGTHILGRRV